MLKKAEELTKEIKEGFRGGKGSVELTYLFKQEETYGKNAKLIVKLTLQSGCSIGLHAHTNDEEIFYILKGKGLLNDNGTEKEVTVGDTVLTGGGQTHALENISNEPLEVLATILVC